MAEHSLVMKALGAWTCLLELVLHGVVVEEGGPLTFLEATPSKDHQSYLSG